MATNQDLDKTDYLLVQTVEGMDYRFEIAGLGARSHAFIIDWHIRFLLALTWFLIIAYGLFSSEEIRGLFGDHAFSKAQMIMLIPAGAIYFLYHVVLEIAMAGRTPGKRMAGVRLINLQGRSPSVGAVLLRNLFRLVDSLPAFYVLGLISVALTKHQVRIGDIASGLVLVYNTEVKPKTLKQITNLAMSSDLNPADQELLLELLNRWQGLSKDTRVRLAGQFLGGIGKPVESLGSLANRETALKAALENLLKKS